MSKKKMMVRTLILASVCAGVLPATSQAEDYNRNIEILRSIPLVTGWEARDDKQERYFADELKTIFGQIQDEALAKDEGLNRATHAKGSCFNGEFTVFSAEELQSRFGVSKGTAARLRQGVFAKAREYPASIRFANGKGDRFTDREADVRALSFSLDLRGEAVDFTGESRLDFSANNSPMFAVNNIHEFYELMKADRLAHGYFSYIPNPFYLGAIKKALNLLNEYQRTDTKSYATENYWMNLPYAYGRNADGSAREVAKFRLVPCEGGIEHEPSEGKADDFLQQDIAARAQAGNVCFLFQAQLFDHAVLKAAVDRKHSRWTRSDWIENGGEEWPENALPFHTVAKLEISKERSQTVSCRDQALNPRLHGSSEILPIGSIARVRAEVEEYSRSRRQK